MSVRRRDEDGAVAIGAASAMVFCGLPALVVPRPAPSTGHTANLATGPALDWSWCR